MSFLQIRNAGAVPSPTILASDDSRGPYGYTPTEWVCITFLVLFGASTLLHAIQSFYFRMWWLLPTACLGGITEILGWSARLWSSFNPHSLTPFEMQISTTIMAPTFLVSANFIILGKIINIMGVCYSRLGSKWYAIVFCTADIISLTVQGVGGASASSAASDSGDSSKGANIMLGGIIFQMVSITVYIACSAEFFVRFFTERPIRGPPLVSKNTSAENAVGRSGPLDRRLKLLILGVIFSTTCVFIRSVYRTIELLGGWTGRIIETEAYFNVLDGGMITLAMYTLNAAHPGFLLSSPPKGDYDNIELSSQEDGGSYTIAV